MLTYKMSRKAPPENCHFQVSTLTPPIEILDERPQPKDFESRLTTGPGKTRNVAKCSRLQRMRGKTTVSHASVSFRVPRRFSFSALNWLLRPPFFTLRTPLRFLCAIAKPEARFERPLGEISGLSHETQAEKKRSSPEVAESVFGAYHLPTWLPGSSAFSYH